MKTPLIASLAAIVLLAGAAPAKTKVTTVHLSGEVNDESATKLIADLAKADSKGGIVEIVITSPGGSVLSLWQMVAAVHAMKSPTVCHIDGLAASAAAVLSQTCTKVVMNSGSVLMFHGAAGGGGGNESEDSNAHNALVAINRSMAEIISKHSGIPVETLTELFKRNIEVWLTCDQALQAHLVDACL